MTPPTAIQSGTRKPTIHVEVSARLTATNHVLVEVSANRVILTQPGPQGGKGSTIELPLGDWDVINETVREVREAIARANSVINPQQP